MSTILVWLSLAALMHSGIADLAGDLNQLSRQLMLQQLYVEERVRSEGRSGVKQVRMQDGGTRPYHNPTAIGDSVCMLHDHPNYVDTLGLGEFIGVLNGVEFRTRHNDYKAVKPSPKSKKYHETKEIALPKVPSSVLKKATVEEQIAEMQEYFRAFKEQDESIRKYKKYFPPLLCYLEGAWTTSADSIEESFASDRNSLDASSWLDLQDKVRYTSYSGHKSKEENFAYLPTTIMSVENGTATLAQWNYRILCHPLENDLPTNRLHLVDDLASRMSYKRRRRDHAITRAARWELNAYDTDEYQDGREKYGLLDRLMKEVPGVDNYKADIIDDALGATSYELNAEADGTELLLNAGYYHRWYKSLKKGAMGRQSRHRGFTDDICFMAMTTCEEVAGIEVDSCNEDESVCGKVTHRWTYAIPMEIVYMNPLLSWNPYDIEHKPRGTPDAGFVDAGGRNGESAAKALNGTGTSSYARTPAEFFGSIENIDPDDTFTDAIYVLDRNGQARKVAASGYRTFHNIGGDVGHVRQRYPIMPLHQEGNAIWKELEALKDIVLSPATYSQFFHEPIEFERGEWSPIPAFKDKSFKFLRNEYGDHDHQVKLSKEQLDEAANGLTVATETSEVQGHTHNIEINYRTGKGLKKYYFSESCDGHGNFNCHHLSRLEEIV